MPNSRAASFSRPDSRSADAAGTELRFDRFGKDGPPLLLLHGIPGWRGSWRKVARRLDDMMSVYVPDLAGFGESSAPAGPIHAAGHAEILLAWLDQLGLERVHVAGHDFGGPLAVELWRRDPERVASLALLATNVFSDTPIPILLRIAKVPLLGELAFRLCFGRLGLSLLWWPAVVQRQEHPWREHRAALRFPEGVRSTRRIFLASLRHLDALYRGIEQSLPRLALPVTVIWGDRDPFFPSEVGRRTAAAIPGARYVELSRTGHFLPEENPAQVAAALCELVGRTVTAFGPPAGGRTVATIRA